jgi:hypothetical protein
MIIDVFCWKHVYDIQSHHIHLLLKPHQLCWGSHQRLILFKRDYDVWMISQSMAVQWLKSIVHGHSPLSPTHPAPKHSYRWTNTTYADTKNETMMPPSLDYSVAVTLACPSWSSRRLSLASYSSGLYRLLGKSRGCLATRECGRGGACQRLGEGCGGQPMGRLGCITRKWGHYMRPCYLEQGGPIDL